MPPSVPSGPTSPATRIRRRFGRGSLTIIALVIGGCVAENYRGHYVWKKYRQAWEAKGERFDLAAFVPKAVPPDQNFAATAFFAPYLDYTVDENDRENPHHWKDKESYESNRVRAMSLGILTSNQKKAPETGSWQAGTFTDLRLWQDYFAGNTHFPFATPSQNPANDVLTALRRYDAVLDELHLASARTYSVFPVHYEEGFRALLPHLPTLKNLAEVSSLRALAHLEAGQSSEATQDAQFGLRLAEALKSEPLLISQFVRVRLIEIGLQSIWEGLARRRWTTEQVAELQSALMRVDILEDYGRTVRAERAAAIHLVELQRTGQYKPPARSDDGEDESATDFTKIRYLPGGVFRQNQFTIAWRYQERIIPLVDLDRRRVDVRQSNRVGNVREATRFHPYALFANLVMSQLSGLTVPFARGQTGVALAVVACALERHRLATGNFPDRLEELAPTFLAKIPADVITGGPLAYRATTNQQFVLYSLGWNETDDGGMPGRTGRNQRFDPRQGDWVWRYDLDQSKESRNAAR